MPAGDLPLDISYDTKGEPSLPEERFENAAQVRDLCQQMIRADDRRAIMREKVDGLVNGFPTYPRGVTAAKGFGWFPRVNYREAEGLVQSQQTPLFDLISEVDHCIEIDLDIDDVSEEEKQDWETSIADNWTWLLMKRWRKSFNYHLPLSQREMLVHGMGAHVWPDKNKWIPRTPRSGQILFPEGCPLDFEQDGKFFLLRDFVPGEDVYGFIRNEEASKKRGWFPDNVWRTLVQAGKQSQKIRGYADVEELQRKVRRGDIGYWNTSQVGLWLNWLFVKEYSGEVSLYCIEENLTPGTNKDKGFLFKKRFIWDEWKEVLVLFPYDVGNGDIHSVRGLGWRTKDFFELSNRVNNAMVAQVLISAFPMMKQNQPNLDPEKLRLARMGALNITPYGLEPSLIQFPQLSNTGLALQQHLKETLGQNNQSLTGRSPEPKDRETKYSFMLRSQDSASVTNGMQSLYESNYQQFQDVMYRRAISTPKGDAPYQKMVEEFRERCRRDGVPDKALKEKAIGEIREVTSSGAGSAAVRLQAIEMLLQSPVYANTTEEKKIQIERDLVSWSMGGDRVDRYARSTKDADLPDMDMSFAVQENNGLTQGGEALIGDGQNDVEHANAHLMKAEQLEQQCEQGQEDPQKCLMGLQAILEHTGQHLQRLSQNPARQVEFKQLLERFKVCQQYTQKLMSEVQSQQNQPDPQQQVSDDLQIGMAKVQADHQVKETKAQADMQLKFRKQAFTERLQDAKTSTGIQRDNLRTGAAIGRDNLSAAHSIQRDNLKTAHTINQDNAKTGAQIQQDHAKTRATINAKTAASNRNGRQSET
jgi:hypothetical protein